MSVLQQVYTSCITHIEKLVAPSHWKRTTMFIAIAGVLLSFWHNTSPLTTFSAYYEAVFEKNEEYFLYKTMADRASNFTKNFTYRPYSGAENRVFRLTLPVFVKIFHIKYVSITLYALQLLLGPFFFWLLARFIHDLLKDKVATFLAVFGIATIYVGTAFFIDNSSYGDFYSFFFLFLAIYFRKNPILVFLFVNLAIWNDERALIGSSLVFLWNNYFDKFDQDKRIGITLNWSAAAVLLSWVCYLLGRYYLEEVVKLKATYNPGEFEMRLMESIPSFGFRIWWQFEAWWLIFIMVGVGLWHQRQYLLLGFIVAGLLGSVLGAMVIYDSTRSGSFGFIVIFFALYFLRRYTTTEQMRLLLFLTALLCFLHPLANKTHGVGFFLM